MRKYWRWRDAKPTQSSHDPATPPSERGSQPDEMADREDRTPTSPIRAALHVDVLASVRIGIATLAVAASRARKAANSHVAATVTAAARACQADVVTAHRELAWALLADPNLKTAVTERVVALRRAFAALEAAAVRLGLGEDPTVAGLCDAEAALRHALRM